MISRRTIIAALPATGLAAAARAQSPETAIERIARTKIMRIGAVNGQPPYCTKDLATGEWSGFMIDIARDLAAEHGAAIAPVESTWGNAVLDVQAGRVDIFFGLAPTPQRALAVDFTQPLFENAFALIARNGFAPQHWDDLNSPDVRIAVELGSVYDQKASSLFPKATIVRRRSNNDALLSLQAGQADCQVLVVILALTTLARNPSLGHLVVPQPVFGSPTSAIVAKAASPVWLDQVNGWIARRRAAGQLRKVLVANLEQAGVRAQDVPPELLF
jgi:polar amino acid transport system substrate-binding protein